MERRYSGREGRAGDLAAAGGRPSHYLPGRQTGADRDGVIDTAQR